MNVFGLPTFFLCAILALGLGLSSAKAESVSPPPSFPAQEVLAKVPATFDGAAFVCDPYCELLSQRLQGHWKPELTDLTVTSDKITLLQHSDPLYAELFPAEPAAPETTRAESDAANDEDEREDEDASTDPKSGGSGITPAKRQAKVPDLWRGGLVLRDTLVSATSDSTVQEQFHPHGGLSGAGLEFGYLRSEPITLWKKKWRIEVDVAQDLVSSKSSLENGASVSQQKTRLQSFIWIEQKKFSWGPKLGYMIEKFTVSENTLGSFSFDEKSLLVGMAASYRRFRFELDYATMLAISEQQPFRDQLKSAAVESLQVSYCRAPSVMMGLEVNPCFALNYLRSDSSASMRPDLNANAVATLGRQEIGATVTFFFGGDFRP